MIDLGFGGSGDYGVVVEAGECVLVEGEAALDGSLAEGDVVHLGAGEVLQGCSVAGAGEETDVDLEVVAEGEADFVLAFGEEFVDEGKGGYVVDGGGDHVGFAGGASDEEVEVAAVSRPRRREPAGVISSMPGNSRMRLRRFFRRGPGSSMRKRLEFLRWSSMPLRSLVTNFSPMRGSLVRCPALAAASRVSMSQTCSRTRRGLRFWGPCRGGEGVRAWWVCISGGVLRGGAGAGGESGLMLAAMPLPMPGMARRALGSSAMGG